MREVLLLLILLASLGINDKSAVEEFVADLHRLVEQSARVVAQIEHEALYLAVMPGAEFVQRLLQIVAGALFKAGDADVLVAVAQILGLDRLYLDHLARDAHREEFRHALAMDGQADLAALRPAHPLDRVGQRHALGEVVIDLDDLVAGLDPRLVGGSVLDRRDHRQHVVLDRNLETQPAEAAAGFDFEVAIKVGGEIGAMRIERRQHPGYGAVDQLFGRDRLDVVLLHDRQHVGERGQLLVGVVWQRVGAPHGDLSQQNENRERAYARDQEG